MAQIAATILIILSFGLALTVLVGVNFWQAKNVPLETWPLIKYFIVSGLLMFFIANPLIVLTYKLAFKYFDNRIWMPQIIFKVSDIIPALILGYCLFGQIPTKGTLAGLILVTAGIIVSVLWK